MVSSAKRTDVLRRHETRQKRERQEVHGKTRGRKITFAALFLSVILLMAGVFVARIVKSPQREVLRVSAAVLLERSFARLAEKFEDEHPEVDVRVDVEPSVTLARISTWRENDVLAVVDHRLIEKMLTRQDAPWVAIFAASEMVLVY